MLYFNVNGTLDGTFNKDYILSTKYAVPIVSTDEYLGKATLVISEQYIRPI